MAACTGLQSRLKNSFECSLFQHLLSGEAPTLCWIQIAKKKSPSPQGAYDLKKPMSGKETATKEYNKSQKAWKYQDTQDMCTESWGM